MHPFTGRSELPDFLRRFIHPRDRVISYRWVPRASNRDEDARLGHGPIICGLYASEDAIAVAQQLTVRTAHGNASRSCCPPIPRRMPVMPKWRIRPQSWARTRNTERIWNRTVCTVKKIHRHQAAEVLVEKAPSCPRRWRWSSDRAFGYGWLGDFHSQLPYR